MKSKLSGAVLFTFFLCAYPASAQITQFLNSTSDASSVPKTEPATPHGAILIRVVQANKKPFVEQAVVQLLSAKTRSATYATTQENGSASFDGLIPGRYTITVSAAGYRTTQRTADVLSPNPYESIIELHRDPSAIAIISREELHSAPAANSSVGSAAPAKQSGALVDADWRPVGVDEERLVTAVDTPCPCEQILQGVSDRVVQLVDNINRFAATEQVTSQLLNEVGKSLETEHRKFDYVVNIEKLNSGDLDVDEYRNGNDAYGEFPDKIATLGLPSLAFIFHPHYSVGYSFACEGLGQLQGHAVWLVYFRQRPDRPARIRGYNINNKLYPISLKGRAWIAVDTFQVMRMEADTVKPMPEIHLRDEHQVVQYQPVHFQTANIDLWLPREAEVYFDFRNHKYHRVHSFANYMLFSVSASQKIGMPKQFARR